MRKVLLPVLIVFAASVPGCTFSRDEGVKIVVPTMPSTLDWSTSSPDSWGNYPIMLATQRGLTSLVRGNEIGPGLASSWERSVTAEGHERYVFHLEPSVRWSDGKTPLTAQDFVVGWRRALVGEERGELSELLGADRVLALQDRGVSGPELEKALDAVGVRAIDPHTLEVVLDKPRSYFLARLATVYLFFPDPSADLAGLTAAKAREYFDRPHDGKPMALGPYRVASWDRAGQRVHLVPNPVSAFKPAVAADEKMPPVTLLKTEVGPALYERGRLDFVFVDSAIALAQLPSDSLTRQPLMSTYFIGFATDRAPLDRVEVRQAIAAAVDRNALFEGLLPAARTDNALLPSELPLSANKDERLALPSFDAARARTLLAKAADVSRPLRLVYHAGDSFMPEVAIAERLQAQLAKMGVRVELEPRADFSAEIARHGPDGKHVFDLYLRRIGADYAHPHTFFTLFGRNGNHQTAWERLEGGKQIDRFEQLLDQGDAASDSEVARERYVEAERVLVRDAAVIVPLYHPDRYYRMRPNLRGLTVDPFNFLSLSGLRIQTPEAAP